MAKTEMASCNCMWGMCSKCSAWKMLIVGIIFLVNVYWPFVSNWWTLVGALLVIGGIVKLAMPCCPHCK